MNRTKPRVRVRTLLDTLGTNEQRKKVMAMLHELRAAHMEEVTITRLNLGDFGRSLKRLRTDAGILQKEMAAKLNISTTYLCFVEAGESRLGLMETILYLHWCSAPKK